MHTLCVMGALYTGRELERRRAVLERVRREERRLEVVLEAQGLAKQLKEREEQLLGTQPES